MGNELNDTQVDSIMGTSYNQKTKPVSWAKSEFMTKVNDGTYGRPMQGGNRLLDVDKDEGLKELISLGGDNKSIWDYKKAWYKNQMAQGATRDHYISGEGSRSEKGQRFLEAEMNYEYMKNQENEAHYYGKTAYDN